MMKSLRLLMWILMITAVTSCSTPMGKPVPVPRDETVSFAGGDLEIRSCGYLREYLVPDDENEGGSEEVYHWLALTVDGKEFEVERSLNTDIITVEPFQITIVEMEPEREVMCTVIVERID